ncbi:gliding motility-associated-like protein [Pontibacter aydingkolensis]|uniref:Gliding motility-associated C-terminal domain-containing protein n=1 Tax=Pontibacter aydingkolensis TaxID=1911536 RepID=A0ABS7CSC2_9BACT|nr:gliding motility-associated C-terminal domain-containing protein [Pontibacter aydingkolensis]MBW7466743.1 gliding motility-associated C-terminal domain-containing protein [Pontibacter aydingkolensis]
MKPFLASFLLPLIFALNGFWFNSALSTEDKASITFSGEKVTGKTASSPLTASTTSAVSNSLPGSQATVNCSADASIANTNYNKSFTYCSYSNSGNTISVRFDFENTSKTKANNKAYRIEWGDGTSSTFGPEFDKTSHTYVTNKATSYPLRLTVTGADGCEKTEQKTVYIGSNPNVLVDLGGNSFSCAPAKYDIIVSRFENNPENTVYTFTINDGTPSFTRTHKQLLENPVIQHTFTEASPVGGFSVSCRASNDCSFSENTWRGIRVSKGPQAEIGVQKTSKCVGQEIILQDKTTSGYDGYGANMPHIAEWEISPATGWEMIKNEGGVRIVFTQPGKYKVKLTASPEDPGTTCEASSKEMEFDITAPPVANFSLTPDPANNCVNNAVKATNNSKGENISYQWAVTDAKGQAVSNWGSISGGATAKDPVFNFTKPGNYNITLTADNGCLPSTKTENITIKGKPIATLPAAQAYCDAQVISFSEDNAKHQPAFDPNFGTITGYNWEVKVVSGQGNYTFENATNSSSKYPAITFKTPAVYEVWAYAINECGQSSAPAVQKITINPLPELVASSPKKAICFGESTTISVTGADTYTWSPATGLSATTGNSVTAKPTETTTYTITGTNSSTGCTSITTYTVIANPLPVVTVTSDKAALCQGQDETILTASGGDTYTWAPATGLSATTGASVTASPAATTTYTVTGYNTETGCSSTKTIIITVNDLPQINAGSDISVCNNPVPIKLTGNPAGGAWSGANVTADGTFTPPSETGKYELTYTYTNSLSCSNSDKMVVTVEEAPVANAGTDKVVCLNSGSFNLTALPAGGIWSGQHVTAAGTFTPSAVGIFTLIYTYGTGSCRTTDEVQVTVNALPTAPVASGTTICPGFSTTLQVQSPTGTIRWFDSASGGNKVGEGDIYTTPLLQQTRSYFVETTIEGGCTSTRREVKVTVRPATPAPVVQPVILCGTGNKAILVAEGNATSYQWFETATSTDIISSDRTFDAGVVNNSRSYFVQAIIDGCISPRTEAKIEVHPMLSNNTLTGVPTICAGQRPVTILGSTPAGGNEVYTYEWESSIESATTGFTKINGATQEDHTPDVLTRTTWFRRTVKSASCSSISDAIAVKVTPVISNNTVKTSTNTIICENSIADEISGSQPEGGSGTYTYLWEISTAGAEGPYKAANSTNDQPNYNPGALASTTWFRRVVTSGTCNNHYSQPVKITVYKPITNNTITGEATICEAETPAVLQGSQPAEGNGNYMYRWEMSHDGTNFQAAIGDNNGINYGTGPLTTTTYFRRVVSGGPCGTNVSNTVTVTVNPRIQHNSITAVAPICSGQQAPILNPTASITGGNSTYTYKWLFSTNGANGNYTTAPGNNMEASYNPGILTQTTWYKREVISGACSSTSTVVEITVNSLPVAPTVNPVTICENTKATLSVVATSGTYKWYTSASATDAVHTGMSYTTSELTANTTYYVESVSTNGCGSPQRTAVTVTVNKNISNNTITAPAQQPICAGQVPGMISGSQPENGNGAYTFRWERSTTGPDNGFTSITGTTAATYQPQALSTTTWFRRVVMSGPCAESISPAVKIEVVPVISNNSITAAQTICEGDVPAAFTGTAPAGGNNTYTYLWQSSTDGSIFTAAAGVNNAQNYINPAALTQTTWYRRVVSSGPCQQDVSAAVKVTVQPAITGNTLTSGDQTICAGAIPSSITGTVPKGGNNTYTYNWEVSSDGISFTDAPGTRTNAAYQPQALNQNTWFRRKVESGNCESYSDAIKITVNATIAANEISESQTICTDTAPQPLQGSQPTGGTGSYTYRWEYSTTGANATDFKAVASNGTSINYAPAELSTTTWFRRAVTSGACSMVSNVVKVEVNPLISKNIVTLSQSIYSGQVPAPLTGSAPAGGNSTYTYLWQYSENGTDFMPAAAPNTGKNYAPGALTKDTWYRRIVYSGGCEHVSDPVKITVTPAVGNNNIQADQVICFGNKPATLTGTTPAGGEGDYTFIWQQSTTGPDAGWTTATGTSNTQNYNPPALSQHTWYRRVVISGPNTSTSAAVMVTVKPAMSNNKISTSQTICFNTAPSTITGTLPTGGSGTYTYLWEISTEGPDKGYTTAPGANNRQDYSSNSLTKTVWLRRVVTSESCDRLVSEAVKITVTPLPKAPTAKGTVICAGSRATLTATGEGGSLEWFASAAGGNPIATGSSYTTPILQHNTSYYVQEVSQSCASERREVKVTVQEPSASAGMDLTVVKGRSVELQATGGVKYTWSPAETLSNPNLANPTASPETTTTYTVTVETEGGCVFTDQVVVTVLPHVFVPNTFTPNRDGVNDMWEILNIEKYPNCKVQVFNQWGNQVFVSDGYKQPWDGLHQGKELPIATYYYIIQLDRTEKPISGSVTIVK